MSMLTDDRQVLAHVARRFYAGRETKSEIAEELGLSRFRIARLLDEAVRTGVVRFEIDEPVAVADELARRLRDETAVRAAVVVAGDDPLDLARAAAAWLPHLLAPDETIAVGWGSTLMSIVAALGDDLRLGGHVVQACGGGVGLEPGSGGPDEAATLLAARLGATSMRLPAPALMSDRAGRDALLANPAVRPTIALFDDVTTVLVGIGAFEGGSSALVRSGFLDAPAMTLLRGRGAVGDLLLYPFDEAGTIVDSGLEERAIVLPLAVLRSARVIAVAGGPGKEHAVAAALRTGLVDFLVTDARCAAASLGASS